MDLRRPQSPVNGRTGADPQQRTPSQAKPRATDLESIFARMAEIAHARERESDSPAERSLGEQGLGKNKRDTEACHCDGTSSVYVKANAEKRSLAVCPSCNPRLHCPKCSGSGHLKRFNLHTLTDDLVPHGCDCLALERRVQTFNAAGIPERFLQADFANVEQAHLEKSASAKLEGIRETLCGFLEDAHRVIRGGFVKGDKFFLTLLGPVGTGKTHMAVALLRHLILDFGHQGKFIDFQFLLQQLRDTYARKTSEEALMRPLRQAEVLVIDEFGKGRTENEWQLEKLDDLVNSRYNEGKVTVLTTNYLTPELFELWQGQMSQRDRKLFLRTPTGGGPSLLPQGLAPYEASGDARTAPANESFWVQTLPERIGARMYDRIAESTLFVDFVGLPSYRKFAAQGFLQRYTQAHSKDRHV